MCLLMLTAAAERQQCADRYLQKGLGLAAEDKPVVACVTRLVPQKVCLSVTCHDGLRIEHSISNRAMLLGALQAFACTCLLRQCKGVSCRTWHARTCLLQGMRSTLACTTFSHLQPEQPEAACADDFLGLSAYLPACLCSQSFSELLHCRASI